MSIGDDSDSVESDLVPLLPLPVVSRTHTYKKNGGV